MADFKKLRGNRILLDHPNLEEPNLYLDDETKEALKQEQVSKFYKLTVYAIGDTITDINIGDEVLVDMGALQGKSVKYIIGGKEKILVSPFDVILVW
jgi:hypothetical protein